MGQLCVERNEVGLTELLCERVACVYGLGAGFAVRSLMGK